MDAKRTTAELVDLIYDYMPKGEGKRAFDEYRARHGQLESRETKLLNFVEKVTERDELINKAQEPVYVQINRALNNQMDVKEARKLLKELKGE